MRTCIAYRLLRTCKPRINTSVSSYRYRGREEPLLCNNTGDVLDGVEPDDGGTCVVARRRYGSDRERLCGRVTLEARLAPADCQTDVLNNLQLYVPVYGRSTNHRRRDVHHISVRLQDFVAELSTRHWKYYWPRPYGGVTVPYHSGHCTAPMSITQLENVAIANALQLEAAHRRAVSIRFNFVARAKFEVAQPICCRLRAYLLFIRYVTL